MPSDIIEFAAKIGPYIEKAGVIGVLVLGIIALSFERFRLLKEARRAYVRLDYCNRRGERYRAQCITHNISVDVSDLDTEMRLALEEK